MSRQRGTATAAMETEAAKTRSFDVAFLVDADSLKRLEAMFLEVGDSLEYQVKMSDGHAIQYHDVEAILRLPNSRTSAIVSLIAGVSGRGKQSIYLVLQDKPAGSGSLGGSDSLPSVEYTVTGSQKNVVYFGNRLDEWTVGIRQWYSIFYHGFFPLLLVATIIGGPIWLWKAASPFIFSQGFLKAHSWMPLMCLVAVWVAIYWLFKLFPRATFAVGQGLRRHQFFTYFRTSVLGGVMLSVLASLLANWLTKGR